VRELENILEFASVVCRNHVIGVEHLPESISRRKDPELKQRPEENPGRRLSLDDLEKQYVYEALRQNDWNRKATASQMGIHPTTLWRKIKRQNIVTPDQDGRSRR
jgi:transcriptional regulator with PAS, ATPase and Fis domain